MIHWEICKKSKFYHTNKWYVRNPSAALENETHKLLRDFEIQTDHLISARRLDLVKINNKRELAKRCYPGCQLSTIERKRKEGKWLDLARELKNTVEHESDNYTDRNSCSWYRHEWINTRTGELGNNKTSGDRTKALLRSLRLLKRVLGTWGDLRSLKL